MKNSYPLTTVNIVGLAVVVAALYLSSFHDYLLFHSLTEIFSITIAFGIFLVAWNSRHLQKNYYLLFLGIAYLFIGCIDLAHTLTYKGLMVFHDHDANTPTQLWIQARYMESISLLIAPVFLTSKFHPERTFTYYLVLTVALLVSAFTNVFPACYVDGVGLTLFKILSEYVICIFLAGAFVMLWRRKNHFNRGIFNLLSASIVLTIFSEIAFTFYISVYGIANLTGHLLKFISFYLIYKALVETGLKEPYEFLFRELNESEKKYRSMFENMLNGFAYHKIILDPEGKPVDYVFLEINDSFEKLTGLRRQDVIGKKVTEVIPGIEKSEFDWIGEYARVALHGAFLNTEQYSEELDRWYSVMAYSPEEGYFAAIFEDITLRKKADEERDKYLTQLSTLKDELERSNSDLQEFASIASHDLQEPLRTVSGFTQMLSSRYHDQLDEKAQQYISFIIDGTSHMQRLLNDLLAFARLGGGQLRLRPVNLQSTLDNVLQNLGSKIIENEARIKSTSLPTVIADEMQMAHLFQNLIANGLKFRNEKTPVIDINALRRNSEWIITVKDNGIGIDPGYAERIFDVFQRLHTRAEYEGTGMGLAICKKIVERHKGKIWVESERGKGAAFYFSIPAQD